MAQPGSNVELVRDAIAAWNSREDDIWERFATPDFEWMPAGPVKVEGEIFRGRDEAARGVTAAFETFDLFEFSEREIRDLGDGALWLGRLRTRGGASGIELEREFALHFSIADARFTHVRGHASWDEALRAAGLAG
jgi:ketosteroid isomerase-like protein